MYINVIGIYEVCLNQNGSGNDFILVRLNETFNVSTPHQISYSLLNLIEEFAEISLLTNKKFIV